MLSLSDLEQLSLHQSAELQKEERQFFNRLESLAHLRNHCQELCQQKEKVEKLSTLHDKLLQQEFALRKLRRTRSEVDSQRVRNDKLAKELGKIKQQLDFKEEQLSAARIAAQKLKNLKDPPISDVVAKEKPTVKVLVEPVNGLKAHSIKENGQNGVIKVENGNSDAKVITFSQTNGHHSEEESDEEIATSFITGWTPKDEPSENGNDQHLYKNGEDFDETDFSTNGHLIISGADGSIYAPENIRPSSDFMSNATRGMPTYRYVPRTQTFLKRIGVDGGRKKTVESLYKDFHPRALHQPVSILDESSEQNTNGATVQTSNTLATVFSVGEDDKLPVRSILSINRTTSKNVDRHVRFDPLALLLDAALDGDIDLVKTLLEQVEDPSAPNDEGITALHNAICAGHTEMVQLLVSFGVDVNSADCDGWTGLHCAASCNNKALCELLVENGAALLALTTPDRETPRDKCEPDEDGFAECYKFLLEAEEQLGKSNDGLVYAAFDFKQDPNDDSEKDWSEDILQFSMGSVLKVLRRGDQHESEWWWSQIISAATESGDERGRQGYVPNSYLALKPRNNAFRKKFLKKLTKK